MTYKAFLAESKRRQLKYVREERVRYAKADKLLLKYTAAMSALGLHPLNRMEIGDRHNQLRQMERDVDLTHGDTLGMKAIWEARHT